MVPSTKKNVLSGLDLPGLTALLAFLPAFRAKQIFSHIARGARSFDTMTGLPRALREELAERFIPAALPVTGRFPPRGEKGDGTVKLRLGLEDGAAVEAVLLRDGKDRCTACLSTQAGCPMGCVFCKTGSLGFLRNLEVHEITEQFFRLCDEARKEQNSGEGAGKPVSHIVVMGMGEPLLNLENLRQALAVLCNTAGYGLSQRRITVSTAGITAGIRELACQGPETELALSLTAAREDLRRRLMPGTAGIPLKDVREALLEFQRRRSRRITLETVLMGSVNTAHKDALALAAFARGLKVVVNVIPWNPVQGLSFEGNPLREPGQEELRRFCGDLEAAGLTITRRYRRGRGIEGACGQLGTTKLT